MTKYVETKVFTPDQAANLFLFKRYDPATGDGYQRNVSFERVKKYAAVAREEGKWTFPVVNGVRHGEQVEIIDGQHRSLAAISAGVNIPVAIWDIPESERAQTFILWNQGIKPSNGHILRVSGLQSTLEKAFEEYGITITTKGRASNTCMPIGTAIYNLCASTGAYKLSPQDRMEMVSSMTDLRTRARHVTRVHQLAYLSGNIPPVVLIRGILLLDHDLVCNNHGTLSDNEIIKIAKNYTYTGVQPNMLDGTNKRDILTALGRVGLTVWPYAKG